MPLVYDDNSFAVDDSGLYVGEERGINRENVFLKPCELLQYRGVCQSAEPALISWIVFDMRSVQKATTAPLISILHI